eukprot:4044162-Amphidinium_carterae.1
MSVMVGSPKNEDSCVQQGRLNPLPSDEQLPPLIHLWPLPPPPRRPPGAKPPPDWEAKAAAAARKARALIAEVKAQLFPKEAPHFKPPPKGFESKSSQQPKGKPPPPCPVLGAIASMNGDGPLPPPPKLKSPPARMSARVLGAEKAAMDRASEKSG